MSLLRSSRAVSPVTKLKEQSDGQTHVQDDNNINPDEYIRMLEKQEQFSDATG